MEKRVSQLSGDYCLNLINNLIDYKGDVARNSKSSSGKIVYSKDFSPNNIRRLILSGDGARIDFHVSVDGRLSKTKVFSDADKMKLANCLMMEDYKPMIWALADRVCSSIEEVIICTQNSAGIDLSRELNFEGLLRNRVNNVNDVKQAISSRYKRLAYFTIINCDISTLIKNQEVASCNNPLSLISETSFVKSISSITKFKDDWFNYYGYASVYSLDNKGSRLNEHFRKIKIDIEESKKKSDIDAIKAERLKGLEQKFEKAFSNYRGIYSCINKLNIIIKTEGTCYYANDINKFIDTSGFSKSETIKSEFESLKTKDECEQYIKKLIKLSSSLYSSLSKWFFDNLYKINQEFPLTAKVFLNNVERRITIPPNCESLVNHLGLEFKGVSLIDSTANICCYACSIFITDVGEHNMSKYYEKDTWMNNFKGGDK